MVYKQYQIRNPIEIIEEPASRREDIFARVTNTHTHTPLYVGSPMLPKTGTIINFNRQRGKDLEH